MPQAINLPSKLPQIAEVEKLDFVLIFPLRLVPHHESSKANVTTKPSLTLLIAFYKLIVDCRVISSSNEEKTQRVKIS